jgi:hypothetical protein
MNVAGSVTGERARRTTRRLLLHSRVQLVVKTTVAATIAWLVGGLVGGFVGGEIGQYRYYAPLGAVVMTYPTIATTVRQASHGILAIAIGGALGMVVHLTLHQSLAAVLLAVALGVGLAGLRFLGDQSSYVPVVALLVVVIGGRGPRTTRSRTSSCRCWERQSVSRSAWRCPRCDSRRATRLSGRPNACWPIS